MDTDQILGQINASLSKIEDKVTEILVDNSSLKCTLKHLTESWQSDHETIKGHEAKITAFEKSFFKTLADVMTSINDNHRASKDYTDLKCADLKKKIDDIQGGYVKYLSIVATISTGIGAGVALLLAKFPSISKFFNG